MSKRRLRKFIYQLGSGRAETGTSSRPWSLQAAVPMVRVVEHTWKSTNGLHLSVFLAPSSWKASVQINTAIAAMEIFVRLFLNSIILIIVLACPYVS